MEFFDHAIFFIKPFIFPENCGMFYTAFQIDHPQSSIFPENEQKVK